MRTLFILLAYFIIVILSIPILLLCLLIKTGKPLVFVGRMSLHIGKAILGIRLDVSGKENFEKQKKYIFMPNHLSLLDGPLMFMLITQKVSVILKKEVLKLPLIGKGMLLAKFIPVDRKGVKGGKKSIEKAGRLMKEEDYSFLIFPEGTRSRDGNLQPFRRGGFFLALDSQAPIVPVSIKGTFELQPKGNFFVKKGKVKVIFHPPIPVQGDDLNSMPDLMGKVRDAVKSGLDPD